ncbi:hypothetical protein IC213_19950 [Clostridioides sp. ES-S-0049-02]|uniref:hypothetical protein n=1 Tax=Clostridioides sp. ES-S-0049-02 TaxID=2770778 RepID=UPI001D1128CE|nr:hypothetical protein [Clostridioides sp. ES-S-0049-02]
MRKIKVIDSIMGSGKSSFAIQMMNNINDTRSYLYVTPYINECERIQRSVTTRNMIQPNNRTSSGKGSKFRNLKSLIAEGENICMSHQLFKYADEEVIEGLKNNNYVLILDEVMSIIELQNIDEKDKEILFKQELIRVQEDGRVVWLGDNNYHGKFRDIKYLANNNNLYMSRSNFMFWTFPYKIFDLFDEAYILTYLFEGQLQAYYYKYFGMEYEHYSIVFNSKNKKYELKEYDKKNECRTNLKKLIRVYEDNGKSKLNSNYFIEGRESFKHTELSASWLRRATNKEKERLKANLQTYFKNICNSRTKDNLWTTLEEVKKDLKGDGYARGFLAFNIRATNSYQDRSNLAYVYNRYINPIEQSFFQDRRINVNVDLLAVSDLLQWIWRSRIRKGEPINIYIPSRRMRELLYKYLNYEI